MAGSTITVRLFIFTDRPNLWTINRDSASLTDMRPREDTIIPERSDPLGEALHLLRLNGTFYCRSELTAPWGWSCRPSRTA